MDDKTRQQEIDRLRRLYYEREKEFKKAKTTRLLLIWLGFAALLFYLFIRFGDFSGADVLIMLVASLILSGFYMYVNFCIFVFWLSFKDREEAERLEAIESKIAALIITE